MILATLLIFLSTKRTCAFSPSITGTTCIHVARPSSLTELFSVSDNVSMALKKASKTMAVVLEYDGSGVKDRSYGDLENLSMQLRKVKASAVVTSELEAAVAFAKEQETAQGNFPGPCPVLYSGDDVEGAKEAGVSAVISGDSGIEGVDFIKRVSSLEDISADDNAFLVDADEEGVEELLGAIPSGSVVLAAMSAMQEDNHELERAKELKTLGVTSVLLKKACVGDNEDIEYSDFIVNGMTKKKSSTFNMSGLTGSTNGHFGGVATSSSTTWLRTKKAVAAA